ncbi:hypothetical protein GCM10007864_41090 [Sinorhizobium fredii]|nr:hypothetical protein GCM10007864_41090 [Sinorhizobium fredii]
MTLEGACLSITTRSFAGLEIRAGDRKAAALAPASAAVDKLARVKVRGQWTYLYRAVDKIGSTIDFLSVPGEPSI